MKKSITIEDAIARIIMLLIIVAILIIGGIAYFESIKQNVQPTSTLTDNNINSLCPSVEAHRSISSSRSQISNSSKLLSGFGVECIEIKNNESNSIVMSYGYVASNSSQQSQGFQNVTDFGNCNGFASQNNECLGMMFVFQSDQNLCFWMHNTPLPLLQAWISQNNTVVALYHAQPETDTTVCHNAMYVLESAPSNNITLGDKIYQSPLSH